MNKMGAGAPSLNMIMHRNKSFYEYFIKLSSITVLTNSVGFPCKLPKTFFKKDEDVGKTEFICYHPNFSQTHHHTVTNQIYMTNELISGKDADPENNGVFNRRFPPNGNNKDQHDTLLVTDPTANNMARINLIGYTRSYYRVLREMHLLVMQYCSTAQMCLIMDNITTQRINYKATNAHSIVCKVIEDMEGGVYDDWRVRKFILLFFVTFIVLHLTVTSSGTSRVPD